MVAIAQLSVELFTKRAGVVSEVKIGKDRT
jgi:hypothetical protein